MTGAAAAPSATPAPAPTLAPVAAPARERSRMEAELGEVTLGSAMAPAGTWQAICSGAVDGRTVTVPGAVKDQVPEALLA